MFKIIQIFAVFAIPILMFGQPVEVRTTPSLGDAAHAPYAMYSSRNFPVFDSFAKTIRFTSGDTIHVYAKDKECDVYFFYKESPALCTQSFRTHFSSSASRFEGSMNVAIPQTGDYVVMANYTGERGEPFGDLYMAVGDSVYTGQSVSNNFFFYPDNALETYKKSCFFTLNANFDTSIFVVEGSCPGRVVAYNDDVDTASGVSWGTLSRATSPASLNIYGCIVMRSPDADAKLAAPINLDFNKYTDLYWGNLMTSESIEEFPFLRYDDAFISGLYNCDYNCISWAVGLWDCWSWPLHGLTEDEQSYLVDDETVDPESLYFFDRFFQSFGFTRNLANESNSVVDLWTVYDFEDNYRHKFTHASVKAFSNDYSTGYDWEAKLGAEERIYHPRTELFSNLYGQPTFYYRKMTSSELQQAGVDLSKGVLMESVSFTEEERGIIKENIRYISSSAQMYFEELFQLAAEYLHRSKISNLYFLQKNADYKKLIALCQQKPEMFYLVLSKLDEGDLLATKLLVDLKSKENKDVMEMVKEKMKQNKHLQDGSQVIMPSLLSQATLFAKGLLLKGAYKEMADFNPFKTDESNSLESFNIHINGSQLTVSYNINTRCTVLTSIISMTGLSVCQNREHKELPPDSYQESFTIPCSGTYIVKLKVNEKTYCRLITIK